MHRRKAAGRPMPIGRRDLIAMLGGVAASWPCRSLSQEATGLPLVGVLWPATREAQIEIGVDAALRSGLKDGGYVEGTNFAFAMRYANGDLRRLAPLAAELAALKPRVIVAAPDEEVVAAHKAAPSVPLVMNMNGDPVALGLVASYARPGGTVTGITLNAAGGEEALVGKRFGLLTELAPNLRKIGLIAVADSISSIPQQAGAKAAGERLGIAVIPLPVRTLDDIEAAFASGLRAGAGAFYIAGLPLTMVNRVKVAELAARAGKPTVGQFPEQARAGLLMSYSADLVEMWRHAGVYAAKILAGTKPSDLPIEQASKFTFVLNLKTAKALGITVAPQFMLLADELIE